MVVSYLVLYLVGNVGSVNVEERQKPADHWKRVCLCYESFLIHLISLFYLYNCVIHSRSFLSMSTKAQEFSGSSSSSVNLHAQATTFARLSEAVSGKSHTLSSDSGLSPVLPVSAEMAKLLPHRNGKKSF